MYGKGTFVDSPMAPASSFDAAAAKRGQAVFSGTAECSTCPVPPLFTELGTTCTPLRNRHRQFPGRSPPDCRYVTTPLRALFDTRKIHKGGFYHDGRCPPLEAVVNHYDRH
jgi:hypothetical protein